MTLASLLRLALHAWIWAWVAVIAWTFWEMGSP
jgi:hypothetical protein